MGGWDRDIEYPIASTKVEPIHDESYSKLTREVLFEKYKPDSKFNKKNDFWSSWHNWGFKTFISPGVYTREIDLSILPIARSGTTSFWDDTEKEAYREKCYDAVVLPDLSPEPLYMAEFRVLDKEFVPP
jgi:hypothetical protein